MKNQNNAKVKLNLQQFSADQLLNFSKHLQSTISCNAKFTGSEKLLEELEASRKEAEAQIAAHAAAKSNVINVSNKMEESLSNLATAIRKTGHLLNTLQGVMKK